MSYHLTNEQRENVNFIVSRLMECNSDDCRAGHDQEYGVWYNAIYEYLGCINPFELPVNYLKNFDPNWYGNNDFAEDVESLFDLISSELQFRLRKYNGNGPIKYEFGDYYSALCDRLDYDVDNGFVTSGDIDQWVDGIGWVVCVEDED